MSRCTQGWTPGRRCHCARCGRNFNTVSSFDAHFSTDRSQCLFPEKAGLVLNSRGVWQYPGDEDFYDRLEASKQGAGTGDSDSGGTERTH